MGSATFKISNLQLSFSGLAALESGQQGIAAFFAAPSNAPALAVRTLSSDSASSSLKRQRSDDEDDEPRSVAPLAPAPQLQCKAGPSDSASTTSFQCPRCRKMFSLSKSKQMLDAEAKQEALQKLRAEHDDFHVAEDLAREVIDLSSSPEQRPPPKKKQKKPTSSSSKGKEAQGIAKYFGSSSKRWVRYEAVVRCNDD